MWGEVSRGTAGETPTPTSCCLKRARQQPACLPACLPAWVHVLVPLLLFLSCPPPSSLTLCCVPLQTQASCSILFLHPPLLIHPASYLKKHLQTSMHVIECTHVHVSTYILPAVEAAISLIVSQDSVGLSEA